jgi:muramoyltetrapeptide carboxypeptidase
VQLPPFLDAYRGRLDPKLFIGYSDTTTLLTWLTCHCGIAAIHGPMLDRRLSRGAEGYDEASFITLVTGGGDGLPLRPAGLQTIKEGEAEGVLYGGTLTMLAASLGTPFAFDPPYGCVLFLEDVAERPYRVDRVLTQLRLAGILGRASALVFGEMVECNEGECQIRDVVAQLVDDFQGPVLFGFPSGHTAGPAWTLPLGVRVRVTANDRPAVTIEESPVE